MSALRRGAPAPAVTGTFVEPHLTLDRRCGAPASGTNRYCVAGTSSDSVPGGQWFDYHYLSASFSTAQSTLDTCGSRTNSSYGTPGYAARSNTCSYNILTNCNSDCWIRYFSTCNGHTVGTLSPCFGYHYP